MNVIDNVQVNSGVNANPITTAVDQYMEQITKKHEVFIFHLLEQCNM